MIYGVMDQETFPSQSPIDLTADPGSLILTGVTPTAALTAPVLSPAAGSLLLTATTPLIYQVPGAVHFAGSTWLQRHAALTGVGAFDKFIFSAWIKLSVASDGLFYGAGTDSFAQGTTTVSTVDYFNMNIADSYFDTYPNTPGLTSAIWQNVLISMDISAAPSINKMFLVNGVDITGTDDDSFGTDTSVAALTDFFFADDGFGARITGDVADVQFWFGQYADFSNPTNIEYFYRDGRPISPATAAAHFGTQTILFSGNSSNFPTNQGSGGAFTVHGSLTNASTLPP